MVANLANTSPHRAIWRVSGDPLIAAVADGPLSGLTTAVKDLLSVEGHPIGAGNPAWLRQAPVQRRHAAAVEALLRAGADIKGIAQTDELGYGTYGVNAHYGTPPNPAAPDRVPGGSSSGCAVAVSFGLADIGLGTDAAGSIRVPASYCGLFGFRPTHGAVSEEGRLDLAPSFDTVAWLARTPHVLCRVSDVLLPRHTPQRIRSLILAEDLFGLVEPDLEQLLTGAAMRWANSLDVPVSSVDSTFGECVDAWAEALGILQAIEMWEVHGAWVREHPGEVSPHIVAAIEAGEDVPAEYEAWARETATTARLRVAEMVPPEVALIHPATVGPAPTLTRAESSLGDRYANVRLLCASTIAGLPVLTVPGSHGATPPVGLSILGAVDSDRVLMGMLRQSC